MEGNRGEIYFPGTDPKRDEEIKRRALEANARLYATSCEQEFTEQDEIELRAMQQKHEAAVAQGFKMMAEAMASQPPPDPMDDFTAVLISSSVEGLRHICQCTKETTVRALYIKRVRKAAAPPQWAERYPWLVRWLNGVNRTFGSQPQTREDHYKAAVTYQMAKALEKCEGEGHIPGSYDDPRLLKALGEYIEYTDVVFPSPWTTEHIHFCHDFSSQQSSLRHHIAQLQDTFFPPALEQIPPHVQPPAVEDDNHYDSDTETGSTVPRTPSSEEFEVVDPGQDELMPTAEEQSGTDPQATDPKPAPPQPEAVVPETPPMPQLTPMVVDAFPETTTAQAPKTKETGVDAVTRSPSKAVQTDKKQAVRWAKELVKKKEANKEIKARRREEDEKKEPPNRVFRTLFPPDPKEKLEDMFLDDDPTDNDIFEQMARAGIEEGKTDVPCRHACISEALQAGRFIAPEKYCQHVRRALACHVVRHPDFWGVPKKDRVMLSVLASLGYIKKDIITTATLYHEEAEYEDRGPIYDLQELYNVEVSNRYGVLIDEPDMLDLTDEDLAEETRPRAHEAQRKQSRRPPPLKDGAPERDRRKQERETYATTHATAERQAKPPEQKRKDAKAAMRRIIAKISDERTSPERVALTILRGNRARQVDQLLQEWHHWLRYPSVALSKGLICWLACCKFNQVEHDIAVSMVYKKLSPFSELCSAPGSQAWIRDLTEEGIEPNPGPGITAPIDPSDKTVVSLQQWSTDRAGLGPTMLTTARRFVEKEITFPSGIRLDVNYSVLLEGTWEAARAGKGVRVRLPPWTTTLYQSTVASYPITMTVLQLAEKERDSTAVRSTPLPSGDVPEPRYQPDSPRRDGRKKTEKLEKVTTAKNPWDRKRRAALQRLEARYVPNAYASGQGGPSGGSTPVQDEPPAPPPASPPPPPEPEEAFFQEYPTQPRVIVAGIDDHCGLVRSARSMGQGVAFPITHQGFVSNLWSDRVRLWVTGRVDADGNAIGGLNLGDRRPIIGVQQGDEENFQVLVGGGEVDAATAGVLRGLKTDRTSTVSGVGRTRYHLLGEWFGGSGNRIPFHYGWRSWGVLYYSYNARTGYREGTELTPTPLALAMTEQVKSDITIAPRLDLTARGLDRTTAEALALAAPPGPSSCEANALKLGLMGQWCQYGRYDASHQVILTGQVQVHEPERRARRDTPIIRLCNNTGRVLEDCGGTVCPTFPFREGWKRGRIRFYASAQCVPAGRRYLVLPTCFENGVDFSEAAVFIMSFLPWPFANLSLALETSDADHDNVHTQIFSWYGTSTVVPGEFELDIVLHMSNVGRIASLGRDDEPVLVSQPTTGGTAVEFWPPYAPIPINYRATQAHYIPAASFAVSWIMSISTGTVNNVLQKIATSGVFDKVERWVHEAQVLTMGHAGLMATDKAALESEPRPEDTAPNYRRNNVDALDADTVPLLYRGWGASGTRLPHVPRNVNWCNVRLPPMSSIIIPDVFAVTKVVAGYYDWSQKFGVPEISMESRILTPTLFVANEKLFCGWHIWHSQVGLPTRGLEYGSTDQDTGKAECIYFTRLFDGRWDPANNGTQAGCLAILEKTVGGSYLTDACGEPIFHRTLPPVGVWKPQVWDLQDVSPLDLVCPTPMPDVVMFKYCDSLPRHLMPFLLSRSLVGNKDYITELAVGDAPDGFYGPYKYRCDGRYYRLGPRSLPYMSDHEVWQARLMHAMPQYQLRRYREGEMLEGVPRPGDAPVAFPRKGDDWSEGVPDFDRDNRVYPFFSTIWMGWADPMTHDVLMLLGKGDPTPWDALLSQGQGGMSDGLVIDKSTQPLMFNTLVGTKLGGEDHLSSLAGNVYGGGPKKDGPGPKGSEGPPKMPSTGSNSDPNAVGDRPQLPE
uniref:Structural protein n=1 Tax=Kashgar Totiv tick virus 1 TaxID=2972343 RepID=A0A9E8ADA8_9VIRU|nr:MAG: structural protein [Kashgar Totiv tick virus 1]